MQRAPTMKGLVLLAIAIIIAVVIAHTRRAFGL